MKRTNFLLLAASLAGGLLVLEVGLRVTGLGFSSPFFALDLHRGWALRPGAESWQRSEGEAYIRINRAGMRDKERRTEKPPNTLRIAVLGDSFTEALQVPLEQTYPAVLERELAGCAALGGRAIEVLNFGVSGYGTAQQLLTLRHVAGAYRPDIVLLAFLTGNDIYNNHRDLNPTNADAAPYFVFENGELVLREPFGWGAELGPAAARLRDAAAAALNRSRSLQAAAELLYGLGRRGRTQQDAGDGADYLDQLIYRDPDTPAMREAWRVTESLIVKLRDLARSSGADFWLISLANAIQVHPDPAVRQEFLTRVGGSDLLYPDKRLKGLCEREGIRGVLLAPPLREFAERNRVPLHGFRGARLGYGHWNQTGHLVAGRTIATEICSGVAARAAGGTRNDR